MREYWFGHNLVGFDGAVLELFGGTDVHRYHIYHLQSLELSTSHSGRRSLNVYAQGGRGAVSLPLEPDDSAARALAASVDAARAARGWPPVSRLCAP